MKRLPFLIACAAAILTSAHGVSAADRVLVAGTKSAELSVIDERLIREETMRLLFDGGFSVVPVMELEREIQERGTILALIDEGGLFILAGALNAKWAIRGELVTRNGQRSYTLNIYDAVAMKKYSSDIAIPDGEYPGLCAEIAKRIAGKTAEFIRGQEAGK